MKEEETMKINHYGNIIDLGYGDNTIINLTAGFAMIPAKSGNIVLVTADSAGLYTVSDGKHDAKGIDADALTEHLNNL